MVKTGNINSSTTQEFLDVYDITNNFVILKNGTVSIVLTVNSMNFGLLAEAEQDAIIYAYAALLNSLNYPIQIIVQSKTKDATAYLNTLKQQEKTTSITNKKKLIARYRQFVSKLIRERNVLDKKFYVVVPATAIELGIMTAQSVLPGGKKFDITTIEKSVLLEKAATTLEPKKDHLLAQFNRIGLYARQMKTQEIIQIFYNNYNPESYEGQAITNTNNYTTPLVQAQIIGGNMNFTQPQSNNVNVKQSTTTPQPTVTPDNKTAFDAQTTQAAQGSPAVQTNPVAQTSQTTPITPAVTPTTQQSPAPSVPGIQESVSSLNIPNANQASAVSSSEQTQKTTEQINGVDFKQASVSGTATAFTAPSASTAPTGFTAPTASVVPTSPIAETTLTSTTTPSVTATSTETSPVVTATNKTSASTATTITPTITKAPTNLETKPTNLQAKSADLNLAQNTINQSLQKIGPINEQQPTSEQKMQNQETKTSGTQQTTVSPQAPPNLTKQTNEKLPQLPEI